MMYLIVFILIVVFAFIGLIGIFNRFVKNRNSVKDAWSNIDVALKKRHDLVPNLVSAVKGYAAHEQNTLMQVIAARNTAISVPEGDINGQIQAENQLTQSLRSLFALAEAYPNLKADSSFLNLQHELSEIEELLERSRRYYNSTVRENNTYGESFPGNLFSGMFNYQHFDFYEAAAAEKENVTVSF